MADTFYPSFGIASPTGTLARLGVQPVFDTAAAGNVSLPVDSYQIPEPVGSTYRGFGADTFNAEGIAREDWMREMQAQRLAFEWESQFNAAEAQKNRDFQSSEAALTRDWQERMRDTYYQSAVEGMKKAGINPVLAVGSLGGPSAPSGATASGSSASASASGRVSKPQQVDTLSVVRTMMNNITQLTSGAMNNITDAFGHVLNFFTKI